MVDGNTDYPQPATCILHETDLQGIKSDVSTTKLDVNTTKIEVKEMSAKLDRWFGPEGTIWDLNERMTRVEGSTVRSHERHDGSERRLDRVETGTGTLNSKVAVIVSIPGLLAVIILVMTWVTK